MRGIILHFSQLSGSRKKGFTLLELSVVLVIIGLVTAMAMTSGISIIATARFSATQSRMKAIDDALLAYATAYNRIPCPANITYTSTNANYGVEGATPGTCTGSTPAANYSATGATNTFATAAEGGVPTATLGIPNDFMYDGWGNRFRYAVDIAMTERCVQHHADRLQHRPYYH